MKITKNTYLKGFSCVVLVLALVRCVFPSIGRDVHADSKMTDPDSIILAQADSVNKARQAQRELELKEVEEKVKKAKEAEEENVDANHDAAMPNEVTANAGTMKTSSKFFNPDGSLAKHRIWSVPSYRDAFPDMQDVQITAANKWGVSPVQNRAEAESRKMELVYVGANPYFFVDPLRSSIPYLVPRASVLDIEGIRPGEVQQSDRCRGFVEPCHRARSLFPVSDDTQGSHTREGRKIHGGDPSGGSLLGIRT